MGQPAREQKKAAINVSGTIREEIAKIPEGELRSAKPGRVLKQLEEAGIEITGSVRSMASKQLKVAKNRPRLAMETVLPVESVALVEACGSLEAARRTLDMVEACGGLEAARYALDLLERLPGVK